MLEKLLCVLIGYLFGCFLTAEIVARAYTGKPASRVGPTGNPGMANIMDGLGLVPGLLVLAGDLLKCVLAMLLCRLLFPAAGWIVTLYAGLGCTLGHDYPFWRKFRGGKGVATSGLAIVFYAPLWGLLANLIGAIVAVATKYLCIAGPVVPLVFSVCMLILQDWEAAILGGVMTVLALLCHGGSLRGIRSRTTKQTDILGALRKKKKKTEQ